MCQLELFLKKHMRWLILTSCGPSSFFFFTLQHAHSTCHSAATSGCVLASGGCGSAPIQMCVLQSTAGFSSVGEVNRRQSGTSARSCRSARWRARAGAQVYLRSARADRERCAPPDCLCEVSQIFMFFLSFIYFSYLTQRAGKGSSGGYLGMEPVFT